MPQSALIPVLLPLYMSVPEMILGFRKMGPHGPQESSEGATPHVKRDHIIIISNKIIMIKGGCGALTLRKSANTFKNGGIGAIPCPRIISAVQWCLYLLLCSRYCFIMYLSSSQHCTVPPGFYNKGKHFISYHYYCCYYSSNHVWRSLLLCFRHDS